MKILGPCTLVQAALPDMLEKTPKEFHQRNIAVFEVNITAQGSLVWEICTECVSFINTRLKERPLRVTTFLYQSLRCSDGLNCFIQENACLVYKGLKDVPGLNPVMPSGAMYMMVRYLCTS